jgi:hypothetical protein
MTTTRQRKAEWISSFGISALETAVSEIIAREGADFLTDEQLEQVVSRLAYAAHDSNRRMVQCRNSALKRAGMPS